VPPTGGQGGNNALRNAGLLVEHLTKVVSGTEDTALETEIQKYEKNMLNFSRSSVTKSFYLAHVMTVQGYLVPYVLRGFMRIVNFFFGV
jgi:hypothetical protein